VTASAVARFFFKGSADGAFQMMESWVGCEEAFQDGIGFDVTPVVDEEPRPVFGVECGVWV
jgi:hypothetical protein